jgi:hypothetical protein
MATAARSDGGGFVVSASLCQIQWPTERQCVEISLERVSLQMVSVGTHKDFSQHQ